MLGIRFLSALLLLEFVLQAGELTEPRLVVSLAGGSPVVSGTAPGSQRLILESSSNLASWDEVARVFDGLAPYPDPPGEATPDRSRFYRIQAQAVADADDWSNQLDVGASRLHRPAGPGAGGVASVKWALQLERPDRVYFQDSVRYPYHIQFARARLPGYADMGVLQFNAQSLYATPDQRMVLGSVFRAPDPLVKEWGIEITGAEAFPAARAVEWIETVRRRLVVAEGGRLFYMPSTEQRAEAEANRALFQGRGIEVASLDRWVSASICYSPGWALGRVVSVPAEGISAALADGRLRLDDILVTDRVRAELPVLAGYLCTQPATPNSHVALLARSLLLPFAHANGAGLQAELAAMEGRDVLLVVEEVDGRCRIQWTDVTGRLTPEQRRDILQSKQGGPLNITPKARKGTYILPVDPLTPADLQFVGGKAANFGFLRRSLPDETPTPVLAVTFDLWDEYLDQVVAGGGTLRTFIGSQLSRHVYPPDVFALREDLAAIQSMVETGADFTPAQRASVIAALQQAGLTGARIRFRSSTNVEDGESFSGAGLYDSYSGCLEDDTDGDNSGPSHCDPAESRERGVFRALRKVYASFYNENAVLERLRHGVRESEVGMAVLVHFSVPDPLEMANGVATFAVDRRDPLRTVVARIVSQWGAESVTNPDVRVQPELVSALFEGDDTPSARLVREQDSSQVPAGGPVMTWETDYRTLLRQMNTAARAYEQYYPNKVAYELDFEFKRVVPGQVGLKQMRAVPHPVPVPPPILP